MLQIRSSISSKFYENDWQKVEDKSYLNVT